MAPEKGMNAIQIAAEPTSGMRLGRIDDETTANLVRGGAAVARGDLAQRGATLIEPRT
jgi:tripeptide aminopeptidase